MGSDRVVVRLLAFGSRPGPLRRIRLRHPSSLPAGRVLERLLARIAAERRAGREVRIECAPTDLLLLLEVSGLDALLRP